MKKLLFLFFALFLVFNSKGVSAAGQGCCPAGYNLAGGLIQVCVKSGASLNQTTDTAPFTCNVAEQCQGGICVPKTKKPDCPTGYIPYPPGPASVTCCKIGVFNPLDCLKKENISIKNSCSSDANVVYEFKNGTCVAEKKTPIFLCLADQSCETAIGNITTDPAGFVTSILKFVVGISGGVALLMLIFAGYTILTSTGDPQKLAGAKEMIVSVVSGIVLIVFSMVLLNAIGVDILGLPGLK